MPNQVDRIEWDEYAIMRWCSDEMRSHCYSDMYRRAKAIREHMLRLREAERRLALARAVTLRGPRFPDRHMEAGCEQVVDELETALRGEGI